jgi:hypothetical protein
VQADLVADRQVVNTLAELIVGGSLASTEIARTEPVRGHHRAAQMIWANP